MLRPLLAVALAFLASGASAQPALKAETVGRWPAPEANQGVAVDARHFYAVGNSVIAKYDRRTGRKVAEWSGDPARFPHLNSCAVVGRELVCAASNYPALPMSSSVEVFDPVRMAHLRSVALGPEQPGSLTWVDRKDGAWWAAFANYDGRGGEPGRDHRYTALLKFDDQWRRLEAWSFPDAVLARFAPRSTSGGAWGPDGRLYVTGHDHTEAYVLSLPRGGSVLQHLATIEVPMEGQAIAFDRSAGRVLFGIRRQVREVVAARLPEVGGPAQ
ncbi:hypothetical protein [Phenylobacterium sp.]|uniref:hypothetical protein n=1 Tax=Phenylobacterium sp. TaxID=1871053 RepID=UPI0035B3F6F9